ncbi:MAG: HEPN domain-containing protein [Candidatus Aminicenantes bacterium]|nr:HEPN domain-containing protein [Candidatus Aminicenantes bacterium]
MKTHDLISKHFTALLEEGGRIIKSAHDRQADIGESDYFRFRTAALNLVRRSCGEDSDHYIELKHISENAHSAFMTYYLPYCYGVVEAAQRDFEAGLLFNIRNLITAEVLGDFIEQAETLLKAEYYVPAASLAGAVLEDTLRKLCEKNGIPIPESTKIDRLNAELVKANVYDKLVQKRITAIADIRNNADHGHFDKFKKEDVQDMIAWIRSFAADYLK